VDETPKQLEQLQQLVEGFLAAGAGGGHFAQDVAQAFDVGFFVRQGALGGLELAAGLMAGFV